MVSKRIIFLSIVTLISATFGTFFWEFWKQFNTGGQVSLGIYVLVLGILFLSTASLLAFLNNGVIGAILISFACSLPVLVCGVGIYSLGALFVIFGGFLFLNVRAQLFSKSLVKPSVALTLSGLGIVITFFSLALSLIYFPQAQNSSRDFKFKIPDQVFGKIYESLTQELTQGTSDNESAVVKTASSYFDSQIPQIRSQLLTQGITDENQVQDQINKARVEYLNQVKQNLAAQNTAGSGQEDVSLIKKSVEAQLNSAIDANRSYIPYILTISLFFTITFFSSIFTGLIYVLVQLYVFILIKSGVVKVTKQSIEAERLTL